MLCAAENHLITLIINSVTTKMIVVVIFNLRTDSIVRRNLTEIFQGIIMIANDNYK